MDLNIFKVKNKFKKSEHQPDPDFYWKVVLLSAFVLILLSGAFGTYLFLKINKEDPIDQFEYNGQEKKISKDRIDAVLEYFNTRAKKSERIKNSPAPVIDPSR